MCSFQFSYVTNLARKCMRYCRVAAAFSDLGSDLYFHLSSKTATEAKVFSFASYAGDYNAC